MRKRILSGIFALMIGLSMALPMRASADWDDHYHGDRHPNAWRWEHYHDYYRAYPYTAPPAYSYAPNYGYGYRRGYIPENGQGMINPRHHGLVWSCDSDGHHCHWARRW
jgi:hypothetical protein